MRPTEETILVIDDDLQVLRLVRDALEPSRYDVLMAENAESGLDAATVLKPSLILLGLEMEDRGGFELCRTFSRDVSLKHIPVIALVDETSDREQLRAIVNCIDDYMSKPLEAVDLETRIALSLRRSQTIGDANPLTRLPGNGAIQEELAERIRTRQPFALLHIDLDEFKAFNDHYGFMRGDEVIKLLGRCARDAVARRSPAGGFLGHVGGDDMAAIVDPDAAMPVAEHILQTWDDLIPNLYEPEDVARGYIEVVDRRGERQRHPLASISIGIATTATRPLPTHWEASQVAAEMKHVAKSRRGSAIAIDRRRQAPEKDPVAGSPEAVPVH